MTDNSEKGNIKIYSYLEEWPIHFPIRVYANGKLIKKLKRRTTFEYKIEVDTTFTFKFASFKKATITVKANDDIDIFLSITTDFSYSVIAQGIYRSDSEYLKVRDIFFEKWHKSYVKKMKKDVRIHRLKKLLFVLLLLFSYYALFKYNFYFVLLIHIIAIIGIIKYDRSTRYFVPSIFVRRRADIWEPDERYFDWVKAVVNALSIKYSMKEPYYRINNGYDIVAEIFDNSLRIKYILGFDNMDPKLINEKNYRFPLYVEAKIMAYGIHNKNEENYSRYIDIGEVDLSTLKNKQDALKKIEEAIFEGEVNKMHEYIIKYYVGVSSSGTTVETVTANSEYNAKQLIINKYPGQEVHILDIKMN